MADNQYINKIQYGNQVLIDLTNDTVDASSLLAGVMAHGADGSIVTGELELSYHVTLHQAQYDQLTTAQKQLANTWYYIDDANNVGVSIADNVIANSKVWSSLKTNAEIQKAKDIAGNGYDTTHTYNTGDYCIYNDEFYVCTDDDVTGAWDSTKWDETTIAEVLSSMSGGTAFISKTQSQYESLPSSEKNDPTKFYYITDTTVSGAPLDDNSSSNGKVWSAQKIGNELASRDSNITALNNNIEDLTGITFDGSVNIASYTASNKYETTCDGYAIVNCSGSNAMGGKVDVYSSDDIIVASILCFTGSYGINSIYVKKGMKLACSAIGGTPSFAFIKLKH